MASNDATSDDIRLPDPMIGAGRDLPATMPAMSTPTPAANGGSSDRTLPLPDAEAKTYLGETIACDSSAIDDLLKSRLIRIGNYVILGEIARGGMGVVYKAKQENLNRIVAIKMMLAGTSASERDVQRFRIEAEATAKVKHPNIVDIFEIGMHEGRHYFSMEFVEGQSLADLVRERPLPPKQAARHVQTIASAIDFAHRHGILHRDLKPSNILIDLAGCPRVTDFGLAKRIDDASKLTNTGTCVGTPSYMPPEQAIGDSDKIGPPADIYALGAILYELILGRPPHQAATPLDTLLLVIKEEPVPPRALNPQIPEDLETITLKCLQKEPQQRYASAGDLADDLGRWLNGEPISARPLSNMTLFLRWYKRNPRVAGLTTAVASLALGLIVVLFLSYVRISNEQQQTELARQRFETYFEHARDTVRNLTEYTAELENIKQMEPVRRQILETARRFHERFLEEKMDDPIVRKEAALAQHRIGQIYRMLGQPTESKQAYEEAIRLIRGLDDSEIRSVELASFHNDLGELLRITGELDAAEASYRRAKELEERAVEQDAKDPLQRRELARIQYNLGILLLERGRLADADKTFQEAIDLARDLVGEDPSNRVFQHDLARCYLNHGVLLSRIDKPEDARSSYAAAIDIFTKLLGQAPKNREFRQGQASSYLNLGNLQQSNPATYADAEKSYHKAVEFLTDLTDSFPDAPDYREDLARTFNSLGGLLTRTKRFDDAITAYQKAAQIAEGLVGQFQSVPDYHHLLSGALGNQGGLLLRQQKFAEARNLLERAVKQERNALAIIPDQPTYRQFLRDHLWKLSISARQRGDYTSAIASAQEVSQLAPEGWKDHKTAAGLIARCLPLIQDDKSLSDAQRSQTVETNAALAVAMLQKAVAEGKSELGDLSTSADFVALRSRSDFQSLIQQPKP